eukprot:m.9397 g.9397  ORF g.9397 m.9397 type:complete len:1096 (+) comp21331_c0_seq1:119-3406(+)
MKVTVCFDSVKVIVPCGSGDLPVRELISRAVTRYKKAVGKAPDDHVVVKTLQTAEDDAILDPDDLISDVADDRDKLIAVFEEVSHRGGDGTSESSTESANAKPEMAKKEGDLGERPPSDGAAVLDHHNDGGNGGGSGEEVDDVTPLGKPEGFSRAMTRQSTMQPTQTLITRWMENDHKYHTETNPAPEPEPSFPPPPAPVVEAVEMSMGGGLSDDVRIVDVKRFGDVFGIKALGHESTNGKDMGIFVQGIDDTKCQMIGEETLCVTDRVIKINGRDVTVLSNKEALHVLTNTTKDFSQIQLAVVRTSSKQTGVKPHQTIIAPPVLAPVREVPSPPPFPTPKEAGPALVSNTRELGKIITIELEKDSRGLGFTVTSRDINTGKEAERPLYVKNITLGGVALRDGRLRAGDRLLFVNGVPMTGKAQIDAVNILRSTQGRVTLQVSRQEPLIDIDDTVSEIGSIISIRHSRPSQTLRFIIPLNYSGSNSLGISVKGKTSTHSAAHCREADGMNDMGIYIKSVVPGGAAFKDGRLMPNDQILVINDESLEAKSNAAAMECLRTAMYSAAMKETIELVIKRKQDGTQSLAGSTRKLSEIGISESPIDIGSDSELVQKAKKRLESPKGRPKSAGHKLKKSPLVPVRSKAKQEGSEADAAAPPVAMATAIAMATARTRSRSDSGSRAPLVTSDPELETAVERSPEKTADDDASPDESESADSPFQRDAVGRLSMSERRKTALDPSHSKVYQERQQKMAERASGRSNASRDSGRSRNSGKGARAFVSNRVGEGRLVRSTSDEVLGKSSLDDEMASGDCSTLPRSRTSNSLTARSKSVDEGQGNEDGVGGGGGGDDDDENEELNRGRDCNDSFRKAVDHSFSKGKNKKNPPSEPSQPNNVASPKKPATPKKVSRGSSPSWSDGPSIQDGQIGPQGSQASRIHAPPARPINPESPDFDTPARRKKKKEKKKFFGGFFRFGKSSKHGRSRMTRSPPANLGSSLTVESTQLHSMRPRSGSLGSSENILEELQKEATPKGLRRIAASEFNMRKRMYDSDDDPEDRFSGASGGRPTPPLVHRHSVAVLPNHRNDDEYDEEVVFSESVQV